MKMNLFKSLFAYIILLKLVVSNGENMWKDTGTLGDPHAGPSDNVKIPESSKTEDQNNNFGEPTKWTGSKPIPPTGNSRKSGSPEADKTTKSSTQNSPRNNKPAKSSRDISSGSSSESIETHDKKVSKQNTADDNVPNLEAKQNQSKSSTRTESKVKHHDRDIGHSNGRNKDNNSPPVDSRNGADSAVNQSKSKDGAVNLGTHRTEKDLKINTTGNNSSSSGAPAPTFPESDVTHISTTEKNEVMHKDKHDAGLKLENEQKSKEFLHTTNALFASSSPPTTLEKTNTSNSNPQNASQPSNKDSAGSPPHFTTTFFQPINSTNEYENMADESEAESKITMENHNDGKVVVTDRTLTGQAITEESDLSNNATEPNSTENSSNSSSNDNMSPGNATLTNSGSDSSSTTSPVTPPGQVIMNSGETSPTSETGRNEKEKVPSSEKPESTTNSTLSTDSTGWTTGTGVPPVNTTANNNFTTMTIQDFFSGLKSHTVLCIICIFLVLITVLVTLSLLLVIYYLLKYTVIGVRGLCKRIGCCSKDRTKGMVAIPEGSLFPRCDVNISPYVENPSFRNSNNRLSTDTY